MLNGDLYLQSMQTAACFYHCLDTNDHDGLLDLISEDTVWVRQGTPRVGPQSILEALSERDPDRKTFHQVTNMRVNHAADEDTATAHYSLVAYDNQHPDNGLQLVSILFVEDTYKLRDGLWRLTEKRASKHL